MIETQADISTDKDDALSIRWTMELENADKHERDWRERSDKVIERYRMSGPFRKEKGSQFNILWSNTETLKPAVYSQTPTPDVRRRYSDMDDDQADRISQAIERALTVSMEMYPFDKDMQRVRDDYLLPGRGVARVRYTPTMGDVTRKKFLTRTDSGFALDGAEIDPAKVLTESGQHYILDTQEELIYESASCEYVPWKWFRISPAETWADVTWVAFGNRLTRDELIQYFGRKVGEAVALNLATNTNSTDKRQDNESIFGKAEVWEIWDKTSLKVYWYAEGYDDKILKTIDDPLELEQFFPIPEPLYSIKNNDTMVPIPEYVMYQDQAEELDILTTRITKLVDAMRARGVFAGNEKQVLDLLSKTDENVLTPYPDWSAFTEKGGLDGIISWFPVEQFGKVLSALYQKRNELIQTIYDLTGISDIMRGSSDPRETKGAQQLKAQFGSRRMLPRARDFQYFVRDLLRLKAEVMCNHFSAKTFYQMTGVQLTPEDMQLMRNDAMRAFRVDVETDSTVAPYDDAEKQAVSEFMQATGSFIQSLAPAVQMGLIPPENVSEMISWASGKWKVSRDLQQKLKQAGKPSNPQEIEQQKQQMQAQQQQQQMQMEQQQQQAEQQAAQQAQQAQLQAQADEMQHKHAMDLADMQLKQAAAEQDMKIKQETHAQDMRIKWDAAQNDMAIAREKAQNDAKLRKSARPN